MLAFALRPTEDIAPTVDILVKPVVSFEDAYPRRVRVMAKDVADAKIDRDRRSRGDMVLVFDRVDPLVHARLDFIQRDLPRYCADTCARRPSGRPVQRKCQCVAGGQPLRGFDMEAIDFRGWCRCGRLLRQGEVSRGRKQEKEQQRSQAGYLQFKGVHDMLLS